MRGTYDLGTTTRVATRKGERIYAMRMDFCRGENLRVPVEKLESTCGANLGWGRAEETWAGAGQKKEEKRKKKKEKAYCTFVEQ